MEFYYFMFQIARDKKGFTLIETFVAISILLIAVMGPLQMFSKAIADGLYAKNQTIAYYLAQEGIELSIHKSFNEGLLENFEDCDIDNKCIIYLDGGDIKVVPEYSDFYLTFNDNSYTHIPGEKTIFWRKIYLKEIREETKIGYDEYSYHRLYSEVGWSHFGLSRSFVIERDFAIKIVGEVFW